MSQINSLIFSSAVLCLSQPTEVARTGIIDKIVAESIVAKGLDSNFTVKQV